MEFQEKARQTTAALLRLGEARKARDVARRIYKDARVWRHDANSEAHIWEAKAREALQTAICALKLAEADVRRIKLAKLTN